MYDTSDLRKGLKINVDGNPYVVVEAQFVKPGKGAAFTRTRMKNLITGLILERSWRSGEKLEPADVEEATMQFSFREGDTYHFMDTTTFETIPVHADHVGDAKDYLADNLIVSVTVYNGRPIAVTPPNFVEIQIADAEPGVRGDTASNVTKAATLVTGASIQVPMFVNKGDVIRIDTRTGEYLERIR
ncbi:MAG: elongation factor P [Myxococcota bacterium]